MQKLLPEEIISYILKQINKPNLSFRSIDLQRCIYNLRNNDKYFDILKQFRFSGSPVAPFSEVLNEALFNLQWSNKIKQSNIDLTTYSFTKHFDKYCKIISKKLDPQTNNLLTELAQEVQSSLKI